MGLTRTTGSLKAKPKRSGSVKRSGSADGLGSTSTLDGSYFDSLPDLRSEGSEDAGSISVVVRVRPLNEKEIQNGDESFVQVDSLDQVLLRPDLCNNPTNLNQTQSTFNQTLAPKSFAFNAALDQSASQAELFDKSGVRKIVEMALEGFSTTVFCYGQTGSGKTHTLTGPPHLFHDRPDPFSEDHGIVYRSFVYLFDRLQEKSEFSYVLKASFLEIYNEKVIDLLNPAGSSKKPLQVRWSRKLGGFYVENLFTVECQEFDDLLAVLEEGMKNRAVGSHSMNEYSSRSHTILTVHVVSEMKASESGVYLSRHGKINFVDLAGSEMTKKTNSQGKTLEEANNINKSLMVLGYCISQLSDPRKKQTHIPYRDSKLTQLLSDSLAGNGVTLMIACISPARSNLSETLNTLRYAARAKHIRNKPVIVMDPREALILSLKREVGALQEENAHLRNLVDLGKTLHLSPDPERQGSLDVALPTPRLTDLPPEEQQQMLQSLLMENRALRRENADLYALREALLRQQEAVTKHNEKLIKQIEGNPVPRVQTPFAGKRLARSTSTLQRSNSVASLSIEAVAINPLSQSFTLQKIANPAGSSASEMPENVTRELTKRGFSSRSKSGAENRISSSTSSSSSGGGTAPSRRKKLTDLKVDLNFVPSKSSTAAKKVTTKR